MIARGLEGPDWYRRFERWLLAHGWLGLSLAAGGIVGVTLWLWLSRKAVPLAVWLAYLYMP